MTSVDESPVAPDHSAYAAAANTMWPGPAGNVARAALAAFAERSPATQADVDQVMRALCTHDGWYVPVLFAHHVWGQITFDHTLTYPEAAPTTVLNVFTDQESAMLASGQPIGTYGGPVSGVWLMRALGDGLSALVVNHASPREHQWYIAAGGFEIAVGWAGAVAVERAIEAMEHGSISATELLQHRYQLLLDRPTRALAQIALPDMAGAVAVCFTATDRAEEFTSSLPSVARPLAEMVPVDGAYLFDLLANAGAAGLVVNAGSDDQVMLTAAEIAEVLRTPPTQ